MATLSKIKKHHKDYCNDKKGSYAKMRSACKEFVDKKVSQAKTGTKGATRKQSMAEARKIIDACLAKN